MITVSQLTKFSIRMCVLSLLTTGIICLAQEHAPEGAFAAMLAANDALITAAERGDIPAIDAALAAGADINAVSNFWKFTPFISAINNHRYVAAAHLIQLGADLNLRDRNGESAFFRLARQDRSDDEGRQAFALLQSLVALKRVNLNAQDDRGASLLGETAMAEVFKSQPLATACLLQAGADVNDHSNYGFLGDSILSAVVAFLPQFAHIFHFDCQTESECIKQLLIFGAEIPADLRENPIILRQSAWLRNTPALIRLLTCGYHQPVLRARYHPDLFAELATTDLSQIDFDAHKFVVYPGEQILPGFDFVATGVTRQLNDDGLDVLPVALSAKAEKSSTDEPVLLYGPEIMPEHFSVLDLAILSGRPDLVDLLLSAGMNPFELSQQTRRLLHDFALASSLVAGDGGVTESKADDATDITDATAMAAVSAIDPNSQAIIAMIHDAELAHATEVQNIVRGTATRFAAMTISERVAHYARATPEFKAWTAAQLVAGLAVAGAASSGAGDSESASAK
ncbi:MAG TPA: ankyrin repeat domain-containing protein [Candidatus Babeliales bacterium]|nr:ankyrin repeat domain-containing protein [Candidatus Babeliales bacterium]